MHAVCYPTTQFRVDIYTHTLAERQESESLATRTVARAEDASSESVLTLLVSTMTHAIRSSAVTDAAINLAAMIHEHVVDGSAVESTTEFQKHVPSRLPITCRPLMSFLQELFERVAKK